MLDSLSFLHSSPPVFSSMNTVNPSFLLLLWKVFRSCSNLNTRSTFLYSKCDSQKNTKPVKKRRENRSWVQWAMLARPTIFFPLLLEWVQFLSFLILMINRRIARVKFKTKLPYLSMFLEKFSARVQIRTPYSTFLFCIFRIATENKVEIGNWRRIADARQFIFFTQFSDRIQFSKYGLPILSFLILDLNISQNS